VEIFFVEFLATQKYAKRLVKKLPPYFSKSSFLLTGNFGHYGFHSALVRSFVALYFEKSPNL
jgi:hypothetical protein